MIDPRLLEILACPHCTERPPLKQEKSFLVCTVCGNGYRINDGIPDLLPEDAVSPEELKELLDGE